MISDESDKSHLIRIPYPFQFNPLKHHLDFIKSFVTSRENSEINHDLLKTIRHIGSSVMDIYNGELTISEILSEISGQITPERLWKRETYARWTGTRYLDFRTVTLTDNSAWTMKYHESENRYIHIFPARSSPHSFRVKANTLKSAILYIITYGKDYITEEDLNYSRALVNLSPVREIAETQAIYEMIEVLRNP